MYCKKCGKEIPNNAKFCTGCGNKVEPLQTAASQVNTPPVQAEPKPARKKNVALPIILAIVAALILTGGGIFAAFKLIDNLSFEKSSFVEEEEDFDDDEKADKEKEEDVEFEEDHEDRDEEPAVAETEAPQEEEVAVDDSAVPSKEEILAKATALGESGDFPAAVALLERALETYSDDPDLQTARDMYQAYMEEPEAATPEVLTTADIVSHDSITSLIDEAYVLREAADAKWDQETEIPGACEYKGYVYLEDPKNYDNNRIYLVFVMNATIKDTPIQFIYWVYYDDIVFDNEGIVSYADMGSSRDDGYLVETAFGDYYSYYGLDDYDMFYEKIVLANKLEVVKADVRNYGIEYPVSDTFN